MKRWKRIGIDIISYLFIMAFTLVLLWTGIKEQSFVGGLDTNFHMNGFYEAARQIATGHYSYFISQFGFNQNGRIVNALYGPIFNYLCGLLLLISHSWIHFQLTLLFITITVAGVGIYLAALKCRINRFVAVFLAFLYMMSHPIITSWFGNSEFMGLGATIMPFLLMSGIDIIQKRRIRVLYLALPMAIMLQIHLMSSLIATLMLIPFAVVGLFITEHKIKLLRNGFIAVLLTTLLSGNIWGALEDVYSSNHLIPTFPVFHMQSMDNSLWLNSDHIAIPAGFFILAVILVYAILQFSHMRILDWTLLVDGLVFLFISTGYFPWDWLWHIWPSITNVVQFPTRFLPIALLTLLLLFGRVLTNLIALPSIKPLRVLIQGVVGVTLIVIFILNYVPTQSYVNWASSTVWHRNYVVRYGGGISKHRHNGHWLRAEFQSPNLYRGLMAVDKVTTDYLPTPHKMMIKDYYRDPTYHDFSKAFIKNRVKFQRQIGNRQIDLTWQLPTHMNTTSVKPSIGMTPQPTQSISNRKRKTVIVPAVVYQHSVVKLNGRQIHPKPTLIGAIKLKSRPGQRNRLTIRYQPGVVFKVMSWVAMLSWLLLLIWLLGRYEITRLVYWAMTKIPARSVHEP